MSLLSFPFKYVVEMTIVDGMRCMISQKELQMLIIPTDYILLF